MRQTMRNIGQLFTRTKTNAPSQVSTASRSNQPTLHLLYTIAEPTKKKTMIWQGKQEETSVWSTKKPHKPRSSRCWRPWAQRNWDMRKQMWAWRCTWKYHHDNLSPLHVFLSLDAYCQTLSIVPIMSSLRIYFHGRTYNVTNLVRHLSIDFLLLRLDKKRVGCKCLTTVACTPKL